MLETLTAPGESTIVQPNELEQIRVEQLKPYPNNARRHSEPNIAKIARSIQAYGFTTPILVTDSLEVIAGHGRLFAAKKLELEEVPCIRLSHLTPQLVAAYRLADNRLALDSDWDEELLAEAIAQLHTDPDFDMALTGFEPEEVDDFMGFRDAQDGEDETPEVQDVAVSKPGDVWVMNGHRLVCGDCTDAGVVAALLAGATPNLMVTDPPYGVEYDANWRNEVDRANGKPYGARAVGLVQNDDLCDWTPAWKLFAGSVVYCWHAGRHASEVQASLEIAGFTVRNQIIWHKPRFVISRGHYHWQHEPCWYAVRDGGTANWFGDHSQTTVWQIEHQKSETGHSTQKPVECMRRPIVNHTVSGDPAYDPFMGSGTTLIAAETTHRVAYGCEIEPLYVDMAVRRWQTFTGAVARLAADNRSFEEVAHARASA